MVKRTEPVSDYDPTDYDPERGYSESYDNATSSLGGDSESYGLTDAQKKAALKAVGEQAGKESNPMDTAGLALISSGDPYAAGAGAGLMVLSARQKRLENEANLRWKEKQARIERQQSAVSRLIGISNSLRNL